MRSKVDVDMVEENRKPGLHKCLFYSISHVVLPQYIHTYIFIVQSSPQKTPRGDVKW